VLLTHRSLFNESNDQIATHWRWTILFASGSVAGYIFLHSIMFFQTLDTYQGNEAWFASILYFGYMSLICFVVFLVTGSVGSIASIFFLHQIISPTAPTEKPMKSVDQKSDEPLSKASLLKESTKHERLDWDQNDINELCDVQLDLLTASLFTCGKCNSTKITRYVYIFPIRQTLMKALIFLSGAHIINFATQSRKITISRTVHRSK